MKFSPANPLRAFAVALALATIAVAIPPPLALKPISAGQVVSPVNISNAGDGSNRLFICDQAGAIYVIKDSMVLPTKFLDLTSKLVPKGPSTALYPFPLSTNYDERGLLGLAFHPNYNKKDIFNQSLPGFGKFYVFYSAPSPNRRGPSTITGISAAGPNPIVVTTSGVQTLTTGDVVAISGVKGGNFSPLIDDPVTGTSTGTFTVTVTGTNTFTVPVVRVDSTAYTLIAAKVSPTDPVNCRTTISEFQVSTTDPNVADPNSERVVLAFDKPQNNHNGGQLEFGPDGFLYISIGDGGSQHDNDYGHTGGIIPGSATSVSGNLGNAQDKTKLLGKILRINPLEKVLPDSPAPYSIPGDNPFAGAGGGVREEIYAFGLRNPWRFSFDVGPGGSNKLFEGDVGQDKVEEVNIIVSGGNYGWRIKEGTFDHDSTGPNGGLPLIDPIAQYAHTPSVSIGTPPLPIIGVSVTGGYVYRGSQIPGLIGTYVFGDYSHAIGSADGTLLVIEQVPANSNSWVLSLPTVVGGNPLTTRVYAFGRDEQGELYIATKVTRGPFELDTNGKPTGVISKIVAAQTSTALLYPSKDNSIYSDLPANSNALGSLYAGNNAGGNPRRALLAFDVAGQIPAGAVIAAAQLSLHLNQSASTTASNLSLYRLGESWGEGTSLASPGGQGTAATIGDATWSARFHDPTTPTLWGTAGGSFTATPSATTTVGSTIGNYSWTSTQFATDVAGWLSTPATNFGWILRGDETGVTTARVFDSREASLALRPNLQVSYNPVLPPLTRRESWLRQYFPTPGTYVDDLADLNGDGVPTLVEYAFALSPLASNPTGPGFQTAVATDNGTTTYTMTFRRDPRATDLTYQLQATDDFLTWSIITQSAGGTVPTGSAFVSETDAPGESPIKIVTAVESFSGPSMRFARLKITRIPQ